MSSDRTVETQENGTSYETWIVSETPQKKSIPVAVKDPGISNQIASI
jgi:hypothetical protein